MRWIVLLIILSSFALAQPISYCGGCSYQDNCVSLKSQIRSGTGLLYCAEDSKLYPAKNDYASCSANYECTSFSCTGGSCQPTEIEQLFLSNRSSFFIPLMITGSVLLIAMLLLLVRLSFKMNFKKTKAPKKGKATKQEPTTMRPIVITQIRKKYSPFDKLEKQIEESTKRITRK